MLDNKPDMLPALEGEPIVETLPEGTKVKRRLLRMRACNERNAKDKMCGGHLKRWFGFDEQFQRRFGAEVYRCEHCKTLYLPNEREKPRSGTLAW